MDRVVTEEEIFFPCQHRPSELSKRQTRLLVPCVTERIVVHVERERPLVQPRYRRPRTSCESIKQRSGFPVTKNAPLIALLIAWKDIEGLRAAWCNQIQHPRFRRSKTGSDIRKFFEHAQHALTELRQQI